MYQEWTKEDLQVLTLPQLKRLAKYYEIKNYARCKEKTLIKKLLKLFPSPVEVAQAESANIPRSVRIRRAYGEKV